MEGNDAPTMDKYSNQDTNNIHDVGNANKDQERVIVYDSQALVQNKGDMK